MYINAGIPYEICLSNKEKNGLSIVALQGDEVSLLPSDT